MCCLYKKTKFPFKFQNFLPNTNISTKKSRYHIALFSTMAASEKILRAGGGHSHWKAVWGCAAVMTPFFQASRRSLAYQFTVNASLCLPPFSIFRKFFDSRPKFVQISLPKTPIFQGKSAP